MKNVLIAKGPLLMMVVCFLLGLGVAVWVLDPTKPAEANSKPAEPSIEVPVRQSTRPVLGGDQKLEPTAFLINRSSNHRQIR